MYGSHDMRHTGFPQVDGGQRDPGEMGHQKCNIIIRLRFMDMKCINLLIIN